MKKQFCALSFLFFFSFLADPVAAAKVARTASIKVMTQNQYLGAPIEQFFGITDPVAFNAGLISALQTVAANKPAERMKALAKEITKERPEIVGLNEVEEFRCSDSVHTQGVGCSDPSIVDAFTNQSSVDVFTDHLQLTLADLNGTYVEAAQVVNLSVIIPFQINGVTAQLTVVDRDVILAREDVQTTPVDFGCLNASADGCNYTAALPVTTPFVTIIVPRGFVGVDTAIDGRNYRLVTTHPEIQHPDPTNPASQFFQAAQAFELLQILLNTTPLDRSLIVLGDMNSDPAEADIPGPLPLPVPFNAGIVTPYHQFVEAGFTDIWEFRPGNAPGATCCQAEDLSNRRSALDQRIDMIFSLDVPEKVKQVRVVGDKASDKTRPPGPRLWPSDHATLTGELQFRQLTATAQK